MEDINPKTSGSVERSMGLIGKGGNLCFVGMACVPRGGFRNRFLPMCSQWNDGGEHPRGRGKGETPFLGEDMGTDPEHPLSSVVHGARQLWRSPSTSTTWFGFSTEEPSLELG